MKDSLHVESEIVFFELEETQDRLVYASKGHAFYQLFPLEYTKELVEEFSKTINDDLGVAHRLLEYRIKDA